MSWFKKKPKYNQVAVFRDNLKFPSKLEAALYDLLASWQRLGIITGLHHQPGTVFLSESRIQYRPDFSFWRTATEKKEWAEAKGFVTRPWVIKKKLWKSYGPGRLHVYGGSYQYLKLIETITPKGYEEC